MVILELIIVDLRTEISLTILVPQLNPKYTELQTQTSVAVHFPFDEQTKGLVAATPKHVGTEQFAEVNPVLHKQESSPLHTPFPLHTLLSVSTIPKQETTEQFLPEYPL